jgi:hypothetical protein
MTQMDHAREIGVATAASRGAPGRKGGAPREQRGDILRTYSLRSDDSDFMVRG